MRSGDRAGVNPRFACAGVDEGLWETRPPTPWLPSATYFSFHQRKVGKRRMLLKCRRGLHSANCHRGRTRASGLRPPVARRAALRDGKVRCARSVHPNGFPNVAANGLAGVKQASHFMILDGSRREGGPQRDLIRSVEALFGRHLKQGFPKE